MVIEILIFMVTFYILLKIYYQNHVKKWQHIEEVPLARTTLLGHLPEMRKIQGPELLTKVHEWLEKSANDSILFWFGMEPVIFTRNRKLIGEISSSNKHIRKSKTYWVLNEWLGDALALSKGEKWRQKRKLLTPAFHFSILSDFVAVMEKHSIDLCKQLTIFAETGKPFNAFELMRLYSIGIISETAMGIECNVVKATMKDKKDIDKEEQEVIDFVDALIRTVESLFERGRKPLYWYKSLFKWFPVGRQYYKDLDLMTNFTMKIIEQRVKNLQQTTNEKSPSSKKIFLDTMVIHYQNGVYSIDEIIKETQAILFGGFDTISTALAWALYMLGRNHEKQERAYKEAVRLQASNLPISEALHQMDYIDCVIKETLRLHPSAPVVGREIEEDTVFDSVLYPKGSSVNLCIMETQRDEKYWKNPMAFEPERFLQDGIKVKENAHFTYIPFSAGPRNCIGQRFAMIEMKITLYHLLLQFEVVALQKEDEIVEVNTIIHGVANKEGLQIKLNER